MLRYKAGIWETVGGVIGAIFFGIVFTMLFTEWFAGCGERTWISLTTQVKNECVFLTWHNE